MDVCQYNRKGIGEDIGQHWRMMRKKWGRSKEFFVKGNHKAIFKKLVTKNIKNFNFKN